MKRILLLAAGVALIVSAAKLVAQNERDARKPTTAPTRRVEEYRIVTAETSIELENPVNHWIEKGWEPTGGVAIAPEGILLQAIVRPREFLDAAGALAARPGWVKRRPITRMTRGTFRVPAPRPPSEPAVRRAWTNPTRWTPSRSDTPSVRGSEPGGKGQRGVKG